MKPLTPVKSFTFLFVYGSAFNIERPYFRYLLENFKTHTSYLSLSALNCIILFTPLLSKLLQFNMGLYLVNPTLIHYLLTSEHYNLNRVKLLQIDESCTAITPESEIHSHFTGGSHNYRKIFTPYKHSSVLY